MGNLYKLIDSEGENRLLRHKLREGKTAVQALKVCLESWMDIEDAPVDVKERAKDDRRAVRLAKRFLMRNPVR